MIYKNYSFFLFFRILILFIFLAILAFTINYSRWYLAGGAAIASWLLSFNLFRFTTRRIRQIDDFFESVKYRDFSRWFVEDKGPRDIQKLHKGFNEVNKTIREMNSEKDTQYVYLHKILEMVDIGIIAYNTHSGEVLWINESFKDTIDFPTFKNIGFVAKRKPELFKTIFETEHSEAQSVTLEVKQEKIKVLLSETVFKVKEECFKLLVLHNIDETLNKNESEAWKKLLSVMTHEIMNSIAPISSLADTLQTHLQQYRNDPDKNLLEPEDLLSGITSIKKRSEGLMKFAKTYRSLNKVTSLNLQRVKVKELFDNIQNLMQPSLKEKNINVDFILESAEMEIEIDSYLVEQVLINLLLNAMDAVKNNPDPQISLSAGRNLQRETMLRVTDNGTGIPTEIFESIFVPFFTTKKNGSGIGLSLCKQIMMLHKGKIMVNSVEGKGSVISLVF